MLSIVSQLIQCDLQKWSQLFSFHRVSNEKSAPLFHFPLWSRLQIILQNISLNRWGVPQVWPQLTLSSRRLICAQPWTTANIPEICCLSILHRIDRLSRWLFVFFFFPPASVLSVSTYPLTCCDISASLLASIQVSSAGLFWYFLLTALIKSRRLCLVSLIGYQSCSCTSKRLQSLILYPPWGILAVVKHLIHFLKSDLHWKI